MTVKQKYLIYVLLTIAGIPLAIFGYVYQDTVSALFWIGISMLGFSYVWHFMIRCPSCGAGIWKYSARKLFDIPEYCPECGESLMDN